MIESFKLTSYQIAIVQKALLNIRTGESIEEVESRVHDFNDAYLGLESKMAYPGQVQMLVKKLNQANQWGHIPKMKCIASELLPYFHTMNS